MVENAKIGWIGLGKMGVPMAGNLVKAGYKVSLFNRTASKAGPLQAAGAAVAGDIASLAAGSDIVVSMISDDRALEAVALGGGGVLASAPAGAVYVDMSTVSPAASARVAEAAREKGVGYVRAPVMGSIKFATESSLLILASGPAGALDACAGIFDVLGRKTVNLGENDEARMMKLSLNLMVGVTAAMLGEALTFGRRGGLDVDQMLDVINDSPLASPVIAFRSRSIRARDFTPHFTVSQVAKDTDLILDTARAANMPMPIVSLLRQNWAAMIAQGSGGLDQFAYITFMESLAGLESPEKA